MKKSWFFSKLLLVGTCLTLSLSSHAQEVSGNVTLTSDYSFRGWSQTTRDPAIQGGFDVELSDSGFAVGTWASTVNFGSDASLELDLYVSYSFDSMMFPWSISMIKFEYPSEGEDLDYMEFSAQIDTPFLDDFSGSLSVGMNYSTEYLGAGGPAFFYPFAALELPIENFGSFGAQVGWSSVDEDHFFGEDTESYLDYRISLTNTFSGLDLTFAFVGTDMEDVKDAEPRILFELSKSL
ncbi:MAG: TorF family putative porin [Gammaproteobacteria bacterium]|nr:TorF family putative porin [Gammaproteobacteria bacterium]MDE0252161.1 TorF family putative porin [Gammaproteobacteria bacterium]MDE0402730.1 TorF family putative porin [Gammaproteobacteria bacterium]